MKIQSRRSVASDGWAIVFSLSLSLTRCRVEIGGILENLRAHSQRRAATDDLSFYLQPGNKLNQITRQTGKEPPPSLTREELFAKLQGWAKGSAGLVRLFGRP